MELLPVELEQFAARYTTKVDPLRQEVDDFTQKNHQEAHMLSGPVQGKLLEMISHMLRPRRILEIGTFTGYSALSLAEGLTEDGLLHTLELREETAEIARNFFSRSPLKNKIRLHVGNAAELLPTLNETWDLVFIDADKPGYISYFETIIGQIRKNGFILADNIFFHGQIFDENPRGKSARAIQAFNDFINRRNDIDKLVLTIRDGLYLMRKL
ncbi:methyltransferase [Niabella ginsenosidivorans]|uniref:Methyltransferase n=1 Tax=Niabella ginsenosidivorans TaxID=1176587 RepID=A0A1A9HYF5_9BACT|nr:O-methyltransferase [Niabella ginsenosidivorans]ANH80125.1 methyltransferase [Niabella ginsenosidivorans]